MKLLVVGSKETLFAYDIYTTVWKYRMERRRIDALVQIHVILG